LLPEIPKQISGISGSGSGIPGSGYEFFAQLYSPPLEHVAEKLTPMQDGGGGALSPLSEVGFPTVCFVHGDRVVVVGCRGPNPARP
jgi:hypothetical protein